MGAWGKGQAWPHPYFPFSIQPCTMEKACPPGLSHFLFRPSCLLKGPQAYPRCQAA